MSTARPINQFRVSLVVVAIASIGGGQELFAQLAPGFNVTQQLNSVFGSVQYGSAQYGGVPNTMPTAVPASSSSRGPLARLIQTPDSSSGMPPFALTDQQGMIQRYVEPVPGVDLASHVGQIVVVRHDTGRTLLASQLDLPSQAITPLIGEGRMMAATGPVDMIPGSIGVAVPNMARQADYVDNDDATVQLLSDDENPAAKKAPAAPVLDPISSPTMLPDVPFPTYPGGMMESGMPGACCDSMGCECGGMDGCSGEAGCVGPCPRCGGFQGMNQNGSGLPQPLTQAQLYAGIEFLFLRTHAWTPAGNFSDDYKFSPRFTLGFDGAGNLGGRTRYWRYDQDAATDSGNSLHVKLNALDLECTHDLRGPRSALILAAGARLASVDFSINDDAQGDSDLLGLTMAADGGIALGCVQGGQVGWVYGGRLSILRGDWDGTGAFTTLQGRDDNVLVDELYVGLQYDSPNPNMNLHARLAFEMQNWRSDVLSQGAGIESISFMGPGLEIGAEF